MNDRRENKPGSAEAPSSGMNLADVYYIIFRHKWKIVAGSILGLIAAGAISVVKPALYGSEAKLIVRYVVESRMPTGVAGNNSDIKRPDSRGDNIMNSEMEILQSRQVLEAVINELNLAQVASNQPSGMIAGWRASAADFYRSLHKQAEPPAMERALNKLASNLEVVSVKKSRMALAPKD